MKPLVTVLGLLLIVSCVPPSAPSSNSDGDNGQNGDNSVNGDNGETAPEGWSWAEIEGSTCANGSTTGLGISEGEDPTRLLLFFAGGGACWDTASCYFFEAAVNIENDVGEEEFAREISPVQGSGFIDREEGPFGDATYVYVPYCTADLHTGDSVGSYDPLNPDRLVHHKGAVNVDAYLAHLTEAYPDVTEIFAVGLSAGGFGAMTNHHRIQDAYPDADIHVLADGAPLIQPRDGRWGAWKSSWNMQFPADCTDCGDSFPDYAEYVVSSSPTSRFGLLTWEEDAVIGLYFSYQYGLDTSIQELIDEVYPDEPGGHASAFTKAGTEHVMLQYYDSLSDDDDQTLRDYVQTWVDGAD